MTPAEFRALREQRYVKHVAMAVDLGISETTVHAYERGKFPVPERIEEHLRYGVGGPCPKCRRTIKTAWHDGLCGACTQPLPETAL